MSALSVLYLILPLPVAFLLHDAEELATQHKWMLNHHESLTQRFPMMKGMIEHLLQLTTKAFAIAAFEEFFLLLMATFYVLVEGPFALEIWTALFLAFSLHLLIHIKQAIIVKGYVPGLVTSILLLGYSYIGIEMIRNEMSLTKIFLLGIAGTALMVVNLRFAHWLGLRINNK